MRGIRSCPLVAEEMVGAASCCVSNSFLLPPTVLIVLGKNEHNRQLADSAPAAASSSVTSGRGAEQSKSSSSSGITGIDDVLEQVRNPLILSLSGFFAPRASRTEQLDGNRSGEEHGPL